MADLPTQARVVIIGGGAAGTSVAYHLGLRGWTDVLLLEKNELTAGSTWHAAGNIPNFSANLDIMRIQAYSVDLYAKLAETVDYPLNYHQTGSIRLAHSQTRMDEFRHVTSVARKMGMDFELASVSDLKDRYPFLETHDLEGGLWDPLDGDMDPAQLTQAFAKGARDLGVTIRRFCPVTGISRRATGEWQIETPDGTVIAEILVNAAGYYAPQIGAMVGRKVPSCVMAHQYLVTDDHPALAELDEKVPLLRDPDDSYYLRQEGKGLILGPYERQATAVWQDGLPDDFSFELYQEDLDRLEWYIEQACARVPILGEAGVKNVINGPIPYAPDGNPLIGPVPGIDNFYECCVFTFGIAQGGGAGKVLADWIAEGEPEWDMWSVDPRRFKDYATPDYCEATAKQVYGHEYACHLPYFEWPAGRPCKTSPVYERLKAKGAQFGARGGWERAMWFARPGDDPDAETTFDRPDWYHRIGEECRTVAERVGILDMPGFSKFDVTGPAAETWLDRLITGRLPKPGRIGLAYFCSEKGGIAAEMTIARLGADSFRLIGPAPGEWHDRDWLMSNLPEDGSVSIENVTDAYGTLVVAGPRSRDTLAKLTDAGLVSDVFPWLSLQDITLAGHAVTAMRVNFVGELGWELHAPMDLLGALYDAIWEAGVEFGIGDFGMYAMESLRLEKCYRGWKHELLREVSPLSAGLDRFVRLDKPTFIGRDALLAEKQKGSPIRFAPLLLDEGSRADRTDAPLNAPILKDGSPVGVVCSGGYGHRIKRSVVLALVHPDCAAPGTQLQVDVFGEACKAIVGEDVFYDPSNARLRS